MNANTKNRTSTGLLTAATLALCGVVTGLATAQQTQRDDRERRAVPGAPVFLGAHDASGAGVRDQAGEGLGSIADFVVDVRHGVVTYAMISSGGVLGLGDTIRAVPTVALRWDPQEKRFTLPMGKEAFQNVPEFEPDDWSSLRDETWISGMRDAFQDLPGMDALRDAEHAPQWLKRHESQTDMPQADKPQIDEDPAHTPIFFRSSDIRGTEAVGQNRSAIGRIGEILYDASSARIGFLTIASGGAMGIGRTHYLAPWESVPGIDADSVRVDIDEARIKDAPVLEDQDPANLALPQLRQRVYSFYRVTDGRFSQSEIRSGSQGR